MFFTQVLDDLSPRCGNISEHARNTSLRNKLIQDRLRKSVRIKRKRLLENNPSHLPVAGGRVFPVRLQSTTTVRTIRLGQRRHILQRPDVAETVTLQVWQTQRPRLENVPQRIGTRVAPLRRVWHRADSRAIEHYQNDSIERSFLAIHLALSID